MSSRSTLSRWLLLLALASCLPEAVRPDAGTDDAGSVVPGTVDAGAVDAGAVDAGTADAGVNPAQQFCRELIAVQAGIQVRCGTVSDAGVGDLMRALQAGCDEWPLPRRGFVATAAAVCLQSSVAASCDTVIDPAICEAVTPGLVAANGACFSGPDCLSGLFCDASSTCPGVCKPRVSIGQPALLSDQCVAEAYLSSGLCSARVALGQSCASSLPLGPRRECMKGGFCNSSSICVAQSLAGPGDDCDNVFPPCAVGLACLGGSQGCVAFAGESEPCGFGAASCKIDLVCASSVCVRPGDTGAVCNFEKTCKWTHLCERTPGMFDGVCKPRIAVNQPCDSLGTTCEPGLFCNAAVLPGGSGKCEPQRDLGSSCTLDEECQQWATCRGQPTTCTPLGSVGAACAAGNDCLSGTCASLQCTAASFCVEP